MFPKIYQWKLKGCATEKKVKKNEFAENKKEIIILIYKNKIWFS